MADRALPDLKARLVLDTSDLARAQTDADQTGAAFGQLGVSASAGLAAAGVAAAGLAVAAGKALVDLGGTFDSVRDDMRVFTGATGSDLDELEGSFRDVASTVPASLDQVGEAVTTLGQKTGFAGDDLEGLSAQVLDLSRITGTDLRGNLDATAALINNWGFSAEEAGPKLDELFRVMQETGTPVGQLADQLATLGPKLRTVGLDFETSAVLAGTFQQAGLNLSTVMQPLTRYIGEMAAQGVPAQEALTGLFEQIEGAATPTEATALAVEAFGNRGAQMADLIRNGTLDVAGFVDSIRSGGDTIRGAAADTADWSEQLQVLKNQALLGLQPLADAAFGGLGAVLTEVTPSVTEATDALGKLATDAAPAIGALAESFAALAESGLSDLSGILGLTAEGFERVGGALDQIGGMGGPAVDVFRGMLEALPGVGMVSTAAEGLGDLAGALGLVGDESASVADNLDTVGEAILGAFEGAGGVIDPASQGTREMAAAAVEAADGADQAASAIDTFTQAVDRLTGASMGAEEADLRLRDAMDQTLQAALATGGTFDGTSESSRALRQAMLDQAQGAYDLAVAQLQVDGDTARARDTLYTQRDSLIAVMDAAGITDTSIRDGLLATYGLLPEQIETAVSQSGAEDVQRALEGVTDAGWDLEQSDPNVNVSVSGAAEAGNAIRGVADQLARLGDRHVTVTVGASVSAAAQAAMDWARSHAQGGIVDYFANGGESHVAQIAPAGAWRVWAEPETGGEAYIPLSPAKRARSLDIWEETGRRLGVGAGPSVSIVVNNPAPEPASTSVERRLRTVARSGVLAG
ncbi:MAG: phage tail tape measure protein [Acidimicrobiales bacterium]|nr:phage tail tape measure protein [Acidimicrobiales bacterium]